MNKISYEVHVLNVGDADAIVIKYKKTSSSYCVVAVIDAGNVGDGEKIKACIGRSSDGKHHIHHAFCTHPDRDHKGGFFDLLEDRTVVIENMYLMNPYNYLSEQDFQNVKTATNRKKWAQRPFNHPENESKNLIDIAEKKGILRETRCGVQIPEIPLYIIGPSKKFYKKIAVSMIQNFVEMGGDEDTEAYDKSAKVTLSQAKSLIDKEKDDDSATNESSLVLLFCPEDKKFLFTGDASRAALQDVIDNSEYDVSGCILKVPHHGSKHNLNTKLIDELSPSSAVISAKGSVKHPSRGIVECLSKYCDVYSTHKSDFSLSYTPGAAKRSATPLKRKQVGD